MKGVERALRISFMSSNHSWGGSEILWSEAAARLVRSGADVAVFKNRLPHSERTVAFLREHARTAVELSRIPLLPRSLTERPAAYIPILWRLFEGLRLYLELRLRRRPDLVVLSQGGNHDGWPLGAILRRLDLPFVIVCQKASDLYWPRDAWLDEIRAVYRAARHVFFVSEHNMRLTEEQLGFSLERKSVVRNPFLVPWDAAPQWPAEDGTLRLACVGRLYPKEKGQDILLRVLAMPKWRERAVSVTFFGEGENRGGLEAMARMLGVTSIRFAGHVGDVARIWDTHHALVLPSRAEGLPLVAVEAMLSGRVVILTDVAGNAELVADGETGFIASAPTEAALDEAMERAWLRRDEWAAIGCRAASVTRGQVPPDPAQSFADALTSLLGKAAAAGSRSS